MSKYDITIKNQTGEITCDVYDILQAAGVTCPALQHLIKKALHAGKRGHKDKITDLQDIVDSAVRARQLAEFNKSVEEIKEVLNSDERFIDTVVF